jgi:hypothetical protein
MFPLYRAQARTQKGGGAAGVLRHQIEIKKKTHFVKKDDINGFT